MDEIFERAGETMVDGNFGGAGWIILRTAGQRTLPLAKSLDAAGFDVWTPTRTFTRRKPPVRGKVVPPREVTQPILPTFVFARHADLRALTAETVNPASDHPDFSIFRFAGRVPTIRDRDVVGLKEAEAEAAAARQAEIDAEDREAKRKARAELLRTEKARRKALRAETRDFTPGTTVRVSHAPALSGLSGRIERVERSNGKSYLVAFGGALRLEIEAWQLTPVDV